MSSPQQETISIDEDTDTLLPRSRTQTGVLLFHYLFRSLTLLVYLFANWAVGSFIISFLLIILFASLDFWTVKNITGRKLVGLRWWNFVDESGQNHWKYESRQDTSELKASEVQLFWTGLIVFPLLWCVFILITFFTFKWNWLIVCLFAAAMTVSNLFGYLRCKWNSRQEFSAYVKQGILKRVMFENPVSSLLRRRTTNAPSAAPMSSSQTLIDM